MKHDTRNPSIERHTFLRNSELRTRAATPKRIDQEGDGRMVITFVHVRVLPEHIEAFKAASLENAKNSVLEPGVFRFDVVQQKDDPERFVLIEIYRTEEDPARHKETAHYKAWRDAVAGWMAEPRKAVHYRGLFPAGLDRS
jgi:(4S)-4-hydroxy-5-phosphonooxypentane-2,3-dione isomerase